MNDLNKKLTDLRHKLIEEDLLPPTTKSIALLDDIIHTLIEPIEVNKSYSEIIDEQAGNINLNNRCMNCKNYTDTKENFGYCKIYACLSDRNAGCSFWEAKVTIKNTCDECINYEPIGKNGLGHCMLKDTTTKGKDIACMQL